MMDVPPYQCHHSISWKKGFRKTGGVCYTGTWEGVVFLPKAVSLIFAVVFALVSAAHLYACWPPVKRRLRIVTKLMLMPLLLLCYLTRTANISPLIILALLFSWFGDAFLLLSDRKMPMLCGILAFGVGHVFYVSYFCGMWASPALYLIAIAAACYITGVALVSSRVHTLVKGYLKPATTLYMLLLCATGFSIFGALVSTRQPWLILAFAGSLLFLVSDGLLSVLYFDRPLKYGNFFVVLTYILAQSCILVAAAHLGG